MDFIESKTTSTPRAEEIRRLLNNDARIERFAILVTTSLIRTDADFARVAKVIQATQTLISIATGEGTTTPNDMTGTQMEPPLTELRMHLEELEAAKRHYGTVLTSKVAAVGRFITEALSIPPDDFYHAYMGQPAPRAVGEFHPPVEMVEKFIADLHGHWEACGLKSICKNLQN